MTPYKRSILQALLDGKTIQATVVEGNWEDIPENAVLSEVWNWDLPFPLRIKPNTIKIGDTEVPEPLREAPDTGTGYYAVAMRWLSAHHPFTSTKRGMRIHQSTEP